MQQLASLGIDPSQGLSVAVLAELLALVDQTYVHHDDLSDTLMTVLDTLDGTNCHLDPRGVLRGVNDRADAYFGMDSSTLVHKQLLEQVRVEDEAGVRLTSADLHADRRIPRGRVFRRDGSSFAASIAISQIGPERRSQGTVLLILDVDDRVAEAQALHDAQVEAVVARRAERNTALFLANMSHELRTPLNAIIGYSELLLESARQSGDSDQVVVQERVTSAGRHLTDLIGQILDLSKVEAGKLELTVTDVDLTELVKELIEMACPRSTALGLTLCLVAPASVAVRTDATRVRQVVINLLSNAVKFTAEGTIRVSVAQTEEGGATVTVTDTGIGIAPEALPRVFHEFEQADATTSTLYGGAGLGLPLSRHLCRLMGGDLVATSVLGKGSTFVMSLGPAPPTEPVAGTRGPRAP